MGARFAGPFNGFLITSFIGLYANGNNEQIVGGTGLWDSDRNNVLVITNGRGQNSSYAFTFFGHILGFKANEIGRAYGTSGGGIVFGSFKFMVYKNDIVFFGNGHGSAGHLVNRALVVIWGHIFGLINGKSGFAICGDMYAFVWGGIQHALNMLGSSFVYVVGNERRFST